MRIFVPGVWLRQGSNDVMVLEMVKASSGAAVESVLEPDFFGPPKKKKEEEVKGEKSKKVAAEGASDAATSAASDSSSSLLLRFPGAGALRQEL